MYIYTEGEYKEKNNRKKTPHTQAQKERKINNINMDTDI